MPGDLIADFIADKTSISVGETVGFTDLTRGNPVSWLWSFEGGDPPSSTLQNPAGITYNSTGNYDVTLSVDDGSNVHTLTRYDYIQVSVEYLMQSGQVTTCNGTFLDTGGIENNYSDNEDMTMTFLPEEPDGRIACDFTLFAVEWESNCDYDWLKVFDGLSPSAPLIGKYCGTGSPGYLIATNPDGALTFQFHSDYSVTEPGWVALVTCEDPPAVPLADFTADQTMIHPGETVSFSDLSLHNPTFWSWNFPGGDPSSSFIQHP